MHVGWAFNIGKAFLLATTLLLGGIFHPVAFAQDGASLFIESPNSTVSVGDTFKVSFYVDTNGQAINAVDADIRFPADKIQVVSPSAGNSLISTWTIQPSFSNSAGSLRFVGAIPNPGINTKKGLISEVLFRVKSVGRASISFTDASRVLLNDGRGTDVLNGRSGIALTLKLPPPAGPIVHSQTHPDQQVWYTSRDISFSWPTSATVQGYSYVLDDNPVTVPDNIVEGNKNSVVYREIADGNHYFHIKSVQDGIWGGVTHFAVKIDGTPPAQFKVVIDPAARTSRKNPIISFLTTDALSGVNRYELKIIPLTPGGSSLGDTGKEFFIEVVSPYIPELAQGKYDIIARAYDGAGNYSESVKQLKIVATSLIVFGDDGVYLEWLGIETSWTTFFIVLFLFLIGAAWVSLRLRRWHHHGSRLLAEGALQDPVIKQRLRVLQEKQKEYKHKIFLASLLAFIVCGMTVPAHPVDAAVSIPIPLVSVFSRELANDELFYIGGAVNVPGATVVVYLQNETTGETLEFQVVADNDGTWFYSHSTFLSSGAYTVWVQTRNGDIAGPPSGQLQLAVRETAFEVGGSRLSKEFVLGSLVAVLVLIILILLVFAFYHWRFGKKKHLEFKVLLRKAEEALHHNLGILRHDIEREFALLQQHKDTRLLTQEEIALENKIRADLALLKQHTNEDLVRLEDLR